MLMSVQPRSWPEPAPEVAAGVRAAYRRREPPLPVTVRDRLGEVFPDAEFAPGFGVRGRTGTTPPRRPTALNTNSVAAWLSHACWLHGLWASAIRRARHAVRRVDPGALLRSTGYATVRLCTLGSMQEYQAEDVSPGQREELPVLQEVPT